jgi:signal transduction histidine kinase
MGSRTRLLLISSLGGLLLLTAITGVAALIIFGRIRAGETAARARFLERSDSLERIRTGIYLSGTLARDYFVEPDGPGAASLLERLARVEDDVKHALARYAGADSAELRSEVFAYWKVLDLMAGMARKRPGSGVDAYFRHQLAQRRETMLHIADDIGAALAREWEGEQAQLAAMYGRFRLIFATELGLVVLLGMVLSVGTVRRLVRLEAETRALSAQLVRAQEQERKAIARELHDEVAQSLSRVLLDVGNAASIAGTGELRSRLDSIAVSAEHIVEEVRRIALSLRPSMLDDLGLVPALEWQAREIGHRTGLSVQVQAEDSAGELPEAHRTCIYRVVQEALQNSARHSGASHVRIGLQKAARTVSLQVEDDGKGFAVSRGRGLGLLGMEERVAQLGGRFRVQSEAGRGTTVTAELPV